MGHHLTSIIFHGLNTFLVVILTIRLVNYAKYKSPSPTLPDGRQAGPFIPGIAPQSETGKGGEYTPIIAGAITGILFGLHPIHVESVAWVAERKDVLYAFFFILSLLSYLKYASLQKLHESPLPPFSFASANPSECGKGGVRGITKCQLRYWYILCLLFFTLSLMSKPMAVTLPVVLLILDFYPLKRLNLKSALYNPPIPPLEKGGKGGFEKGGRGGIKVLIEKIPFLCLSLASSVITILAQKSGEAMASLEEYPLWVRIWVSIKALGFYLFKIVLPGNLAPFYPYPDKISFINLTYIVSLLFVVITTVFCIYSWHKGKRIWLTVWVYYVLALFPVLGIVKIGAQAASDRYTYLPGLGPFILLGVGFSLFWEKTKITIQDTRLKKYILIPLFLFLALLSLATVNQIKVWKDSLTLWNTVIKLFPDSYIAYKNRGIVYLNLDNFKQAIDDCNKAVELNSYYGKAYHTRGKAYLMLGNHEDALRNFNQAIALDPKSELFYFDRKLAYQLAIKDYSKAIKLNPGKIELYINRGSSFATIGQFDQALEDFNKAISLNSQLAIAYYNRGMVYRDLGKFQDATKDFQTAARLGDKQAQDYLKSKGIGW